MSRFLNRHPVIAMALGWIVLLAIALVFLPTDASDFGRVAYSHRSAT